MHLGQYGILSRSIQTVKKTTETLVVARKEIGLEGNAKKTKYMPLSLDQSVGQNHIIKIDNKSFDRVEQFKYLGTTPRNENSFQKEIKSRLN